MTQAWTLRDKMDKKYYWQADGYLMEAHFPARLFKEHLHAETEKYYIEQLMSSPDTLEIVEIQYTVIEK